MPKLFDPEWAYAGDQRAATAAEMASGFVCGPADRELFNWLISQLQKALNQVAIPCKTEMDAADPAIVPANGNPVAWIDDTVVPRILYVWDCDAAEYVPFVSGQGIPVGTGFVHNDGESISVLPPIISSNADPTADENYVDVPGRHWYRPDVDKLAMRVDTVGNGDPDDYLWMQINQKA
ncbi:MAG: hypothetical protein KDJ69_04600 [Nitratireductor sp.]|nr:hypothetical protein [Nitratireductor sp.]